MNVTGSLIAVYILNKLFAFMHILIFLPVGLPPSVIVQAEGELRRISEISNGKISYSSFLPQKEKITGLDFNIEKKIVFIGSRQGRKIKGYHFYGNCLLYIIHI